ncbi:hypothetical protein CDAR_618441 [Caerostris darwini]|uniref:Uncharacterized protein n=1 Tax=Caerostris darwini TaxID=1538125 RepID=A0AAV4SWH0_9ARAC|nr:hypothetical protein CDAR_618441 [Caerostris darwini]
MHELEIMMVAFTTVAKIHVKTESSYHHKLQRRVIALYADAFTANCDYGFHDSEDPSKNGFFLPKVMADACAGNYEGGFHDSAKSAKDSNKNSFFPATEN